MKGLKCVVLVVLLILLAVAGIAAGRQSIEPPLDDTHLTVNTLVREDIFAGFLSNDMARFSRGEKNIDLLLEKRPGEKPELLAWKGGAILYRAVLALEDNHKDEFQQKYRQAVDLLAQAQQLQPNGGGTSAIVGGVYAMFADRLPQENRAAAWSQAYENYKRLWKLQGPIVARLPVHLRGELLAGLAQSAQRTGHTDELAHYLDQIQESLPGTPYEAVAKKWKSSPEAAASGTITCMTCHDAGRLAARLAAKSNS